MIQRENAPIVVAIDGTQEGLRALDYVVDQAQRDGFPLVLVHVVRAHPVLIPHMVAADVDTDDDLGRAALAEARARVLARFPGASVTDRMLKGSVRHELPRAAADARLLVLGRTPLSGLERRAAGSAGISVIAQSTVPVVSVPGSWVETEGTGVVAAVSDEPSATLVLRTAFEQARATGTRVVAIRAVDSFGAWSDDLPVPPEAADRVRADAEREFAAEIGRWSQEFPDVQVELRVVSGSPPEALLPAAADSQLVVVASRRPGEVIHPRLGSTVRNLLAHAPCPVLIMPAGRPHLPPRMSVLARTAHPPKRPLSRTDPVPAAPQT